MPQKNKILPKWKGWLWLAVAFFAMCMGVQYNDPDLMLWVGIYSIPALLTTVLYFRNLNDWILLFAFTALASYTVLSYPPVDIASFNEEQLNEFGGLTVSIAWLLALRTIRRKLYLKA